MSRKLNWNRPSLRRGQFEQAHPIMPLDECIKPAMDALKDLDRIRKDRECKPQVVYDSGWFDWRRGESLPQIESFRVNR